MSGGAGVVWQSSPAQMADRVEVYGRRLIQAVIALAEGWARRLEAEMKAQAPWTDRTGAARAGLFGRILRLAAGAVIVIGGTAPHQVFLERRWAGRYAIIAPTLQRNLAAIIASLQQLVRG